MRRVAQATHALFALISYTQSAVLGLQNPTGSLLNSSFGVPGNQSFDYVIVGGGTAGLVLAHRLSENSVFSVAVIEAGGFYEIDNGNLSQIPFFAPLGTNKDTKDYNPLVDWGFATVPQEGMNNATVHYARGKCLGGSSARNFMIYQRGSKESHDMWADLVGDSSYKWDPFLPYFQKSLDFSPPDHRKRAANATPEYDLASFGKGGGPLSVTFSNYAQAFSSWVQKGLVEIGIKPVAGFTSGTLFGSAYTLSTIESTTQTRESSETGFLQPALKRSNLVVFQKSLAKKILFDNKKTAIGVVVDSGGKKYTLSAKKEVILSAGVFQSPQLLMVSGIGPASTLQKYSIPVMVHRSGVGQNMWDHVWMGPSHRVNVITTSTYRRNFKNMAQATDDFINKQDGILTNPDADLLAWEKLPSPNRKALSNSTLASLAIFPSDWPEVEYISVAGHLGDGLPRSQPTDSFNYGSVGAVLVAPLSRGTVTISSADTADPPVIDPRWLTDPADQAVAVAAYKRVRQLFATKAMAPVLIGPEYYPGLNNTTSDKELLALVKRTSQTVWHAACTCRMGKKDDKMAVVDQNANVIGVKRLRVVDASSFAVLPPGHPSSTVYALAEKIADNILGRSAGHYYSNRSTSCL